MGFATVMKLAGLATTSLFVAGIVWAAQVGGGTNKSSDNAAQNAIALRTVAEQADERADSPVVQIAATQESGGREKLGIVQSPPASDPAVPPTAVPSAAEIRARAGA